MKAYVVRDKGGRYFCADAGDESKATPCAGCGMRSDMVAAVGEAQLYPSTEAAVAACREGDAVVPVTVEVIGASRKVVSRRKGEPTKVKTRKNPVKRLARKGRTR